MNKNRISQPDADDDADRHDVSSLSGAVDQRVDFRQFVKTLAIFRPMSEKELRDSDTGADFINSKKEKLRFSFRMYDIDGNGEIQEGEIMEVGGNCMKFDVSLWFRIATRSSVRLLARTAHSFACSALLVSLARSATLNCLFAHSLTFHF